MPTAMSLLSIGVFVVLLVEAASVRGSQPNIVYIKADDLGWAELGYQNGTKGLFTPNIDALAAASAVLESYYTYPLCSPTRSALMTGRYTHRTGLSSNVIYWDTPWAPSLAFPFLPQRLKKLGYDTAMYGKWHLGMFRESYYPSSRGFDEFGGYLQGCGSQSTHISNCCAEPSDPTNFTGYVCPASVPEDFRGFDWFNGTDPELAANGTASSLLIAAAAERYIAASAAAAAASASATDSGSGAGAPFFLYLPFQNIHAPYDCSPSSYALFANVSVPDAQKVMYGYIYELDLAVGRVVAALEKAGLNESTVIVFASDNGAPQATDVEGRNYPLRGFKAQSWDGGTRVPAFVHAPGRLPPGRRNVSGLVHVTDWTPTLVALAGGTVEEGLDGVDVWGLLDGSASSPPRGEVPVNINPLCDVGVNTQYSQPTTALRVGDMKLLCFCYNVSGIANQTSTGCVGDPANPGLWPQLYNLTADPSETTNIAASAPDIVAAIEARLAVLAASSVEPMVWDPPYQGPDYECASCPKHPPGTGPFVPWTAWL